MTGQKNDHAAVFCPTRSLWHRQLFVNIGESIVELLDPRTPRCSHLGCALHYNKQEHFWECGCHGSRFAEDGHLLQNPAQQDIHPKAPPRDAGRV